MQICAALGIGKRADSKAIGWVELFHQEFTACLHNLGQLEEACCRQQALDVIFFQFQSALMGGNAINEGAS